MKISFLGSCKRSVVRRERPIYMMYTKPNTDYRKEGMFYLTTHSTHFILRLYGVGYMVKDHLDSERGNPLPPHRLLFPISNKGSFICIIPQRSSHHEQTLLPRATSRSTKPATESRFLRPKGSKGCI